MFFFVVVVVQVLFISRLFNNRFHLGNCFLLSWDCLHLLHQSLFS